MPAGCKPMSPTAMPSNGAVGRDTDRQMLRSLSLLCATVALVVSSLAQCRMLNILLSWPCPVTATQRVPSATSCSAVATRKTGKQRVVQLRDHWLYGLPSLNQESACAPSATSCSAVAARKDVRAATSGSRAACAAAAPVPSGAASMPVTLAPMRARLCGMTSHQAFLGILVRYVSS